MDNDMSAGKELTFVVFMMHILAAAMDAYYRSRLATQIANGLYASRTWTTNTLLTTLWKTNRSCLRNERHEAY